MLRNILFVIIIGTVSGPAWAAGPAVDLLRVHLRRAQRIESPRRVDYQFETDMAALGESRRQHFGLKHVHDADESYFFVEADRPTKVLFAAQSLCSKAGEGWTCEVIDRKTFEKNLKSPNMILYPPTAMYLVEQLLAHYSTAVTVSAAGVATIATHRCDAFRVAVDGAAIGAAALAQYLYVAHADGRLLPYVIGTTLQLCFDRGTGQVLEYRNEVVLDQQRMHADGFGDGHARFAAQPVGVIRGGFVATRIQSRIQ